MANLPVQQARNLFTKAYIASFKEIVPAPSFLRSFFQTRTTASKSVAIEVQRGTERIAVDVLRGVDSKRNIFSKSTEKEFIPPFFNEEFDATMLDRYDRVFGQSENFVPQTIGYLARDVAEKYDILRMKIERAKEKQAAEVFETGIVTMNNGDNIDYKRKSASKVDLGAGNYWTTAAADVEAQLIAGAEFIRKTGKNGTPEFNLIMSGAEYVALKKTDFFTNTANYNQVKLVDISMPQTSAFGAGYHGQISAGAYTFNIWTYDEVYEAAGTGAITRYLPANIVVMTPVQGTKFYMSHAGVPAIIRDKQNAEFGSMIMQMEAEYYLNNYIDPKGKAHIFEIMSAPLAVPVTVDMIYTIQALA